MPVIMQGGGGKKLQFAAVAALVRVNYRRQSEGCGTLLVVNLAHKRWSSWRVVQTNVQPNGYQVGDKYRGERSREIAATWCFARVVSFVPPFSLR